jgi:C4-dicarboxylate transporter DctM subunit
VTPLLAVLLVLLLLLVLLFLEVPVAFALSAAGIVGVIILGGSDVATGVLASTPFSASGRVGLVIIPMFILMGLFVTHSGIANEFFDVISRLVARRVPGGLGVAAVMGCAGFSAVTGSSVAVAATLGRTAISEMRRHGYRPSFAAGVIAAAGTLGILIPPSIVLVIYGILTGESIGLLLLAGIIPGILSAAMYAVVIISMAKFRSRRVFTATPDGAPADVPGLAPRPARGVLRSVAPLAYVGALFVIVIGGIYSGVFTATEAGAIGAFAALLMMIGRLGRSPSGLWSALKDSLRETASATSMIFMLLVGGAIFTYFLVVSRTPVALTDWVIDLPVSPTVIVIVILLAMIPLGMILDGLSILLIVVPLTYPVVTSLGFDGIWYGILVVKLIEIGLITPPVGISAYVVAGVAGEDVSAEDVFRGSSPFLVGELLTVALLFALPSIVTWLPGVAAAS